MQIGLECYAMLGTYFETDNEFILSYIVTCWRHDSYKIKKAAFIAAFVSCSLGINEKV